MENNDETPCLVENGDELNLKEKKNAGVESKDETPCLEENAELSLKENDDENKDETPFSEENVDELNLEENNDAGMENKDILPCIEENKDELNLKANNSGVKNKGETPCLERKGNKLNLEESNSNVENKDEKHCLEENGAEHNLEENGAEHNLEENSAGIKKAEKRRLAETEDDISLEEDKANKKRKIDDVHSPVTLNDANSNPICMENEDESYGLEKKVNEHTSGKDDTDKPFFKKHDFNKKRRTDALSQVDFNDAYYKPDFIKSLSKAFCQKEKATFENGAKIISEPFTCCVLPNFIQSEDFINKLKTEVEEIEVEVKLNDLYQFKQSKDLADFPSQEIITLKNLLYETCLEWMKKITNIPLTDQVDMSCSCYTYTDHLLCHDDELEGRRIAYIYYLTPDWEEKDGGMLDLFNTVKGEPSEVVTSFVPTWNNFIFFEVGPTSFHQVSEILAYKTRTSISGWFYGPPLERTVHPEELSLFKSPTDISVDIKDWINPTYLQPETQVHIRQSFEESSEMELMDFLQCTKYEMVCQALNEKSIEWKQKGPPNRRKLDEFASPEEISPILKECQTLFCSEPFFMVLSNLTGLRLHPYSSEEKVKMGEVNSCIRRWSHGSYSLLHEQSFYKCATLNAALCFNCPEWDFEYGGYTSYVAKNEKEELLRVDPKPNSLALVYITEGTSSFVKYINKRISDHSTPCFHDIFSIYREVE